MSAGGRDRAALAALSLLGCGCHAAADTVASSHGDFDPADPPVVRPVSGAITLNDPVAFRWEREYRVYSTGSGIAVHGSPDLLTFAEEGPVFAANPAWIAQSVPQATKLWSPDVRRFGGLVHLYYAASTFGSNRSCIGHATTTAFDVAFADQGPLVCSNVGGTVDDWNAIDPAVFLEGPDDPWLVFGSYDGGIKLIALDRDGNRRDAQMVALAARPADNPAIQAPFLYRWRDTYYLFVSFDTCCNGVSSTHNLRVGRSQQLVGPYLDRDGRPMLEGGGSLVLAGDARWKGPGSNAILDDGTTRLNLYHAYDGERDGTAVLRIAPLFFDEDGWPVTAGP